MGQQVSLEGSSEFELKTPNGIFKGLAFNDLTTGKPMCYRFTGVRYALPKTERWVRHEPIPDNYDYSDQKYDKFSKVAPQPKIEGPLSATSPAEFGEEDCAYLNIWVPASVDFTKEELPVLFYIHGGWMQYGNACHGPNYDSRTLLSSFDKKFIIVAPAYRLNSLGFLTSKELAKTNGCNFGFWDQRLALEWTARFAKLFGGDKDKITVAGLSAGSYSTFFQLAYEVYHPNEPQYIKQVVCFSNCLFVQPKSLDEVEAQFEEYCQVLGIDSQLSTADKILKLKSMDAETMMEAIPKMKMHTFRAVTDDDFVSSDLLKDVYTGAYGKKLYDKGIRMLIGEVDNEPVMYSVLNTPKTVDELPLQIENYYPKQIVDTLLSMYDTPTEVNLQTIFGEALADSQVYSSSRTFLYNSLKRKPELFNNIFRYRISFLSAYAKKAFDSMGIKGAIHASDQPVWFFANANTLTEEEKSSIYNFLLPYIDFVCLDNVEWGTDNIEQYRYFSADGEITVEEDKLWDAEVAKGLKIFECQL